ncbi:MAG: Wzz/FepE/Etk N-terminal domain-containing protein, partial [Gammaproteobacteria bacterium]|nr:Wzz/FepE/Etk N-terminal domain-containing protein [Gammaproteobacteria bacterium]
MSSDKQASSPIAYQQQPVCEGEISLVDIVNVLLRRKKFILGITVFVVCMGLLYAFTQKRIFQVETILFPPSPETIQSLNLFNSDSVNSTNVFTDFTRNTNSRKLRK